MRYQQGIRSAAAMMALLGIGTSGITQADDLTNSVATACGTVVTHSVVLYSDLVCTGDGLIVGTGGITINLNGHTLQGAGTGTGIAAVDPAQDISGFKVVGGTISGFAYGIKAYGPHVDSLLKITLQNLTIAHSENRGIDIFGSINLKMSHGRLTDNGIGIVGQAPGVYISVSDSYISDNGGGISVHDLRKTQIIGNVFVDNGVGFSAFQSSGNTLARNEFRSHNHGIRLSASDKNVIIKNKMASNIDGLMMNYHIQDNLIADNQFIDNSNVGMTIGDGIPDSISGISVVGNLFRNNGASGLWFRGSKSIPEGISISKNQFIGNGYSASELVDENGRPLNDGLHVYNPAPSGEVEVANNRALHNAGNGIEAAVVIDGGRNIAAGNGESPQCLGVVCQPWRTSPTTK